MCFAKLLAPQDLAKRSLAISGLYEGLAALLQRTSADAVLAACYGNK